jgi:hypothetical protein
MPRAKRTDQPSPTTSVDQGRESTPIPVAPGAAARPMGPARTPAPKIALPKNAILFHYAADDEVVFEWHDEKQAARALVPIEKQLKEKRFDMVFIGRCRGPNGIGEYHVAPPRYYFCTIDRTIISHA